MAVWVFNAAAQAEGPVPFLMVPPLITGERVVGETLTAQAATWFYDPTSTSRQWYRCSTMWGTYTAISGETGATYTPVSGDNGYHIVCDESATNAGGTTVCRSCPTLKIVTTPDSACLQVAPTYLGYKLWSAVDGSETSPDSYLRGSAHCRSADKTKWYCNSSQLATPLSVGQSTIPADGGTAVPVLDFLHLTGVDITPGYPRNGALLNVNSKVLNSIYNYYGGPTAYNIKALSEDLTTQTDWQRIVGGGLSPDYFAGSMVAVPASLQASLGGDVLIGLSGAPIVSRESLGLCMAAFNSSDVDGSGDITASLLIYFTETMTASGQSYADVAAKNEIYQPADLFGINCLFENYDTIALVSRHGWGERAYGPGTNNPALANTPYPSNPTYNYAWDPTSDNEGTHAYPYHIRGLCYKRSTALATSFADKPTLQPYAMFVLTDIGDGLNDAIVVGGFFDSDTNILELDFNIGGGQVRTNLYQWGDAP